MNLAPSAWRGRRPNPTLMRCIALAIYALAVFGGCEAALAVLKIRGML